MRAVSKYHSEQTQKSTSNQKVAGRDTLQRVFGDWHEVKESHVSDNYAEGTKNSATGHLIKPLGNLSVSEVRRSVQLTQFNRSTTAVH